MCKCVCIGIYMCVGIYICVYVYLTFSVVQVLVDNGQVDTQFNFKKGGGRGGGSGIAVEVEEEVSEYQTQRV